MTQNLFFDELMDELATQSMARFGHNIFGKNSHASMVASAMLTTSMQKTIKQHGNNPNAFGQASETLEVGKENIKNAYNNTGIKTYTTDELDEIRRTKTEKDFRFRDTIKANYSPKEIDEIVKNTNLDEYAKTNHTLVDTLSVDKNGNVVKKEQLKAVSDNIFSKRYDKYFEAGVSLRIDSDAYEGAENEIEKIKQNLAKAPKHRKEIIREKLKEREAKFNQLIKGGDKTEAGYIKGKKQEGKMVNHTDGNKALNTVYKIQAKESLNNIVQTGASDALAVALGALGSSVVCEIEDEFVKNNHEDFTKRIERVISNVINAAKGAFARGAGFGVLDALITIASQIFKQIGGKIKEIWSNLRNAAKSIWNALWDYISGKIKTFKDFIKVALKAIFSMVVALYAMSLESQITAYLSPILSPLIAGIISTALTIFICAFAVVVFSRTLEISINGFFAICAKAEMAKKRREEIEALYDKIMPQMIENKENLEKYLNDYISDLEQRSELSFNDLQLALASDNYSKANDSICKLAELYGVKGLFKSNEEFVEFLENDEPWF